MFVEKHEHTGADGGPLQYQVDLSGLTVEELRKLAAGEPERPEKD
jgi:hypothetical protein